MRLAHTVAQVRAAEAELAGQPLMDRAVAGLAATCARLLTRRRGRVYGSRVLVLAGSGDNGGDALFAGARLARRGAAVTAVLLSPERAHRAALAALRAAGGRLTVDQRAGLAEFRRADLILDGIVGIGGTGGLRPAAEPYAREPRRGVLVAVDLPSGVDADTGEVAGAALRADLTVTFGTHKPGLLIDPGPGTRGRCSWCRSACARPPRPSKPCSTPRWARCCRGPAPRATSTGAAWSACWPAPSATRARRCSPSRGRCTVVPAPSATRADPPRRWSAATPRCC